MDKQKPAKVTDWKAGSEVKETQFLILISYHFESDKLQLMSESKSSSADNLRFHVSWVLPLI